MRRARPECPRAACRGRGTGGWPGRPAPVRASRSGSPSPGRSSMARATRRRDSAGAPSPSGTSSSRTRRSARARPHPKHPPSPCRSVNSFLDPPAAGGPKVSLSNRRTRERDPMASIRKDILIDRPAPDVWAAVADVDLIHERLARGFVTDTQLEGDSRLVTFANGAVVHELIVRHRRRCVSCRICGRRVASRDAAPPCDDAGHPRWRASQPSCVDRRRRARTMPRSSWTSFMEQGALAMQGTLEAVSR